MAPPCLILSSKVFLAKCSLYFRINLLQASEPSSEKHLSPYPKLISLGSSSECANNLYKVEVMFAHGDDSRINKYVLLQSFPSSLVWIYLSQLKILRMADNWVCSPVSASLCCFVNTDDTHSMNLDSFQNALLAMLPVEVVPPEGSGWSTFNPVFSCTRFRTNIMDWRISLEVGDHFSLPQFKW